MIRTTAELVAGIIEVDGPINLGPFLLTASTLVDLVQDAGDLSSETLELIERWLSAHFYSVRDPRPTSEKAGPVGASYQSKVDLNLASSHYGQTAMVLDTTGTLKKLNKDRLVKASVTWLGTEED